MQPGELAFEGLREVVRVATVDGLGQPSCGEPFVPVLAKALQEPVAGAGAVPLGHDHRLGDQPGDGVEDVVALDVVAGAHRFGGGEVEGAGEHGQAGEHVAIGRLEQAVGPVDRRPQGLVARFGGAPAAGQDTEPAVEPVVDLGRRHGRHPGGRQLDGERDPVEPAAQPRDDRGVVVVRT